MQNKTIYNESIRVFGAAFQIEKMIEECAELIKALQNYKQNRPNNVAEEVADVEIMCSKMRLLFPGVKEIKKKNIERLEKLIYLKSSEDSGCY